MLASSRMRSKAAASDEIEQTVLHTAQCGQGDVVFVIEVLKHAPRHLRKTGVTGTLPGGLQDRPALFPRYRPNRATRNTSDSGAALSMSVSRYSPMTTWIGICVLGTERDGMVVAVDDRERVTVFEQFGKELAWLIMVWSTLESTAIMDDRR